MEGHSEELGTKDPFKAVGSGWLQADNGHILQLLKQITAGSLLRRGGQAEAGQEEQGFCGPATASGGQNKAIKVGSFRERRASSAASCVCVCCASHTWP